MALGPTAREISNAGIGAPAVECVPVGPKHATELDAWRDLDLSGRAGERFELLCDRPLGRLLMIGDGYVETGVAQKAPEQAS
jgi:hypothetical protein